MRLVLTIPQSAPNPPQEAEIILIPYYNDCQIHGYGSCEWFGRYSHIVSRAAEGVAGEALDSNKNILANLSTFLSEDMDTTPVIRPVMDMSNISMFVAIRM